MGTELLTPDFTVSTSTWTDWATGLQVTTAEEYTDAADKLKTIKALSKEIESSYGPLKQKASEAHKAIVAEEKRQLAPLQQAEAMCKDRMLTFQRAEQERAEAERRRLQAEADERARREREALEKKAAAAKKPETQQKYTEAAASVQAPVVNVASQAPKANGVSIRKVWKARIVDATRIPREFLLVDETKLDRYAKAMKEMAKVDGVEFYEDSQLAARV